MQVNHLKMLANEAAATVTGDNINREALLKKCEPLLALREQQKGIMMLFEANVERLQADIQRVHESMAIVEEVIVAVEIGSPDQLHCAFAAFNYWLNAAKQG